MLYIQQKDKLDKLIECIFNQSNYSVISREMFVRIRTSKSHLVLISGDVLATRFCFPTKPSFDVK